MAGTRIKPEDKVQPGHRDFTCCRAVKSCVTGPSRLCKTLFRQFLEDARPTEIREPDVAVGPG
jgi:hypothetical protein